MAIVGKVESLWRYPVKSMRGEELSEAFVGFAGVPRNSSPRSTRASRAAIRRASGIASVRRCPRSAKPNVAVKSLLR